MKFNTDEYIMSQISSYDLRVLNLLCKFYNKEKKVITKRDLRMSGSCLYSKATCLLCNRCLDTHTRELLFKLRFVLSDSNFRYLIIHVDVPFYLLDI